MNLLFTYSPRAAALTRKSFSFTLIYTSAVHAGEPLTVSRPVLLHAAGHNQENIYTFYKYFKNKINSAAVKMCRLIQFLYSGSVKVGVSVFFYLTYLHNQVRRTHAVTRQERNLKNLQIY